MIDRILENWLDKSSERSYQLPFCYLLMQQGKTILHLTRHNAMEHGKDIIARDAAGQLHVYQLKGIHGGKLKLKDWQQGIQQQLMQLVFTPVTHPSSNSGSHHVSYLVLNGEIEEEVFNAIHAFNSDWKKKGYPQYAINTVVRGEILQWAYEIRDQFIPSELQEFKSLLEFYLDAGTGFLDKGRFSKLIGAIYQNKPGSMPATKRLISSGAVLCSLALNQFQENKNHVAIIEGWMVYIAEVLRFSDLNALPKSHYQAETALADKIILNALEDLLEEVTAMPHILLGSVMEDVFFYKHRITILLGLLSYFGTRLNDKQSEQYLAKMEAFIGSKENEVLIWGEGAIPYIINMYWFYRKIGKNEKAQQLLVNIFEVLIAENKNKTDSTFTNFYLSAEESIFLIKDEKADPREIEIVTNINHVAETIIHLLAMNQHKTLLQQEWKEIATLQFIDFEYPQPADIFTWRCEEGTEVTRPPKEKMTWEELYNNAKIYNENLIPNGLKEHKQIVPLFLMVYPHRFRRNLVIWMENSNEIGN